jgi:transcriptional regulator GlxA family with amidase domain
MARAACLSPNHFLRSFKKAFHQTPHQYLTARRLERARALLRQTDLPVIPRRKR